jgi:hypothetical protein
VTADRRFPGPGKFIDTQLDANGALVTTDVSMPVATRVTASAVVVTGAALLKTLSLITVGTITLHDSSTIAGATAANRVWSGNTATMGVGAVVNFSKKSVGGLSVATGLVAILSAGGELVISYFVR